ncbi:hypothetical protein GS982_01440 [Rhodococcus hoagii]|uniref:Uncharacterized protein n=1 Tax=Rhodococcus hoagii TaxID=43767 RepID=A0A9Q4ZIN4_RHOHA|nr:hypothetical protein [Prescottella equi]NKT77262.1 hypothetical protein [Prescottella equi]NKZ81047.1 hypothetical protein [Prescottella equi]
MAIGDRTVYHDIFNRPIISDNFQGSSGNLTSRGWTDRAYSTGIFTVSNGAVTQDTATHRQGNMYYYNTPMNASAVWGEVRLVTIPSNNTDTVGVCLGVDDTTAVFGKVTTTGWRVTVCTTNSTSSETVLGSGALPAALRAGDILGFSIVGQQHCIFINGNKVGEYIGASQVGPYAGIHLSTSAAGSVSDFRAGVVAHASYGFDDFNRANGLIGGAWSTRMHSSTTDTIRVNSNKVSRSGTGGNDDQNGQDIAYYLQPMPGNQLVEFNIATRSTSYPALGAVVGWNADVPGQIAVFGQVMSTGWRIFTAVPGERGKYDLLASGSGSYSTGLLRMEKGPNWVKLFHNRNEIGGYTGALPAGHYTGINLPSSTGEIDNFFASSIPPYI